MEDTIIAGDGHIDLRWLPHDLCVSHAPAPWKDQVPHVRDTPTGKPWSLNFSQFVVHTYWLKRCATWHRWRAHCGQKGAFPSSASLYAEATLNHRQTPRHCASGIGHESCLSPS